MRSFVSVAEGWVLRDGSADPSPRQRDEIRTFSSWLSNRFPSPDTIPDVAQAWEEFLHDPSERMYSVWHTPPYSTMRRTDPLPSRTFAEAQHRAEEYRAAGESAGIYAMHPSAGTAPASIYSGPTQHTAGQFLRAERSGHGSPADMPIDPTRNRDRRLSLLAAAGIAVVGITILLVTTMIAHWIELQLY